MFWIGFFVGAGVVMVVLFVVGIFRVGCYRTTEQEMADRDAEAIHWRKEHGR